MKDTLKNLFKIKPLMILIVSCVFAYMAVTGKMQPETVAGVIAMVFTFYFTNKEDNGDK